MSIAAPPLPLRLPKLSPEGRRLIRLAWRATALLGLGMGIQSLILHLGFDPFIDARRFYEAGARLNDGLPLYGWIAGGPSMSSTPTASLDSLAYLNPPLLAILFRPLALLPFTAAVLVWEALLLGASAYALWRAGMRENTLILAGCLMPAFAWALAVGQSEPIILALLSWGSPLGVALAGQLKLMPLLAAAFWLVRRDVPSLVRCAFWSAALTVVQVVLAPADTLAYLQLGWLRGAMDWNTISPYRVHPLLWVALVVALVVAVVRTRDGRWGWASAVALSVLAHPRLLLYQLLTLLAAFGGPRDQSDNA